MSAPPELWVPTVDDIRANRARLGDLVIVTPVRLVVDDAVGDALGESTRVWLKEELFQRTGSFKPRGALSVMLDLDDEALGRGVTGVSAGNHAISLAYSARILGTNAKVVMPATADPFRVKLCEDFGGLVEFVGNVHEAFDRGMRLPGPKVGVSSTPSRVRKPPSGPPRSAWSSSSRCVTRGDLSTP